jgi:hypothetical protein
LGSRAISLEDLALNDRIRTYLVAGVVGTIAGETVASVGVIFAMSLLPTKGRLLPAAVLLGLGLVGGAASGVLVLRRHPALAALLARMVDPDLISMSALQLEDLVELARGFRAWEGGTAFLGSVAPEHALAERWRARVPEALWAEVERWLERYGHRGAYENDLASARPADDLRLLAAALRPMVLAAEPPEAKEARRADAESAWREARALPASSSPSARAGQPGNSCA